MSGGPLTTCGSCQSKDETIAFLMDEVNKLTEQVVALGGSL